MGQLSGLALGTEACDEHVMSMSSDGFFSDVQCFRNSNLKCSRRVFVSESEGENCDVDA